MAVQTRSVPWRRAMDRALYGPEGFFVRGAGGPSPAGGAGHFRTSAASSAVFARAVLRLVDEVDDALGNPAELRVIDVGAGRAELLARLVALAPDRLARRLRPVAVEVAPRPADLPEPIAWLRDLPEPGPGVLLATEWLDNVPLDIAGTAGTAGTGGTAERADAGRLHYLLVDPVSGEEMPGQALSSEDAAWASRWWPVEDLGVRVEVGRPRDEAWAAAVGTVTAGLALTVDYGHLRERRPPFGTLAAFRAGRSVDPVPDGSCDVTAHVAMDAVRAAGERTAGRAAVLLTQAEALRALGADGARPSLALASSDPTGYVRALAEASEVTELTDPAGLGGHYWLLQPVGIDPPSLLPG